MSIRPDGAACHVDERKVVRQVQGRLLPPTGWLAVGEFLLRQFPRRSFVADLLPVRDIQGLDPVRSTWLATGTQPTFRVHVRGSGVPTGWVYLETVVQRSMGHRVATLTMRDADGGEVQRLQLPSNLRGSVREVFFVPAEVAALEWQPTAAGGFLVQTPLIVHAISAAERDLRILATTPGGAGLPWRAGLAAFRESLHRRHAAHRAARVRQSAADYGEYLVQSLARRRAARESLRRTVAGHPQRPFFEVVLRARTGGSDGPALASLNEQAYPDWRLHPASGDSPRDDAAGRPVWWLLLDDDDQLEPDALLDIAAVVLSGRRADLVYGDHDFVDAQGRRHDPSFKPAWNADLFLTHDYLATAWAVRASAALAVGIDAASLADASRRRCLVLAIAARRDAGIVPIVHVPELFCRRAPRAWRAAVCGGEAAPAADAANEAEVVGAVVEPGALPGTRRIRWPLPEPAPRVTIVIPTRDQLRFLEPCVRSIDTLTDYAEREILIVDNQSSEPATLAWLEGFSARPRCSVIRFDDEFNYSAMNNLAARAAGGEVLALLNNDIEVIEGGWLTAMVRQAVRPDVGAVGAKLLYPDRRVQHAGVLLGIGGMAGHAHRFLGADEPGYGGRAALAHEVSAVTGACLVVARSRFIEVGGFNERDLKVSLNDVDLCLKLRARGYRNIFEPAARLIHHESVSRGLDDTRAKRELHRRECRYMQGRWQSLIDDDPAYNINLTRISEDFSVRHLSYENRPAAGPGCSKGSTGQP